MNASVLNGFSSTMFYFNENDHAKQKSKLMCCSECLVFATDSKFGCEAPKNVLELLLQNIALLIVRRVCLCGEGACSFISVIIHECSFLIRMIIHEGFL